MAYEPIFPAALQPLASTILPALRGNEVAPASPDGFSVIVGGEQLAAPYRVYYAAPDLRAVIDGSREDSRTLALCLGTRHWDGYVREECLRSLIADRRPWAAPFIVQLLGEYVVEIAQAILAVLQQGYVAGLAEFVTDNPSFMATTRRRVVSYWHCYYRPYFPTLQDYPAHVALELVEKVALGLPCDPRNVNTTV
jgi:hypothetical protein